MWAARRISQRLAIQLQTVIDRRNTAERVAKGAVRQLFANLRQQQLTAQGAFGDHDPTPARMRTVVVGHSFGGLIAFSALAQAELNEFDPE